MVALAVCAAAVLLADGALRWSDLGRALVAENVYLTKPAAFSEDPHGADVVVTGDSRIGAAIDPAAIATEVNMERGEALHVWNAGLSGAPPMAQLAWVRRILGQKHRARLVIMGISPYMFSSRIQTSLSRESLGTFYRLGDIPAAFRAGASAEDVLEILTHNVLLFSRLRARLLEVVIQHSPIRGGDSFGPEGFIANAEVEPAVQATRANGRAIGYRTELWKPEAQLGNEQMGYFVEALRELEEARVPVVVLNTPSASQMELAYGPRSLYDEHIAYVRSTAARFGATWVDGRSSPAVSDRDFMDGDHLAGKGASRYSAWLAHTVVVPSLGGRREDRPSGCATVFAFDDEKLPGWTLDGEAVRHPLAEQGRHGQTAVYGQVGARFFSTYGNAGDDDVGEATSPQFLLTGNTVRLRVAGGAGVNLAAELVVEGKAVDVARGREDEVLRDTVWNVKNVVGKMATLRIRDHVVGAWGHLEVNDVAVCP